MKIQSKNVQLLDPYYGQPSFLRPIGQTRWQKQLQNLNKDSSLKLIQQSYSGEKSEGTTQSGVGEVSDSKPAVKRRQTIVDKKGQLKNELNSSRGNLDLKA